MCWNASVSINTFLFSSFVLALIVYNNSYTKYKIQEVNDTWMYLFILSFVFMQLIEFFLWRNINNKFYNNLFSICAVLLLICQPIASLMMLQNVSLRNMLLCVYLLGALSYSIYQFSTRHIHTTISKGGHLHWNFFTPYLIAWAFWLFFLFFSLFYEPKPTWFVFSLFTLYISYLNYRKDESLGTMWCWSINSIMIYYAAYLLIYLPFLEKNSVC